VPEIEIGIHPGKVEIYNPGSFPDDLTPLDFISRNLPSYKINRLILDILFRSKDVEKSGTRFQRVNDFCKQQNVTWNYRKEAYGFFFEFIRTNVRINVQINAELTEVEQVIFNLIQNNEGISKAEMAIRIGKSEKTVQRIISSLMKKQVIERDGSNKTGSWRIRV
jgi:ATP-dependent DNA helicase RecG